MGIPQIHSWLSKHPWNFLPSKDLPCIVDELDGPYIQYRLVAIGKGWVVNFDEQQNFVLSNLSIHKVSYAM